MDSRILRLLVMIGGLSIATVSVGCAHQEYFPGTTILRTEQNRKIIETVEQYRRRLLERNPVAGA